MKITICGSSTFFKEMLEFRDRLREMGHEAVIHPDYEKRAKGIKPEWWDKAKKEHAEVKKQYGFIKWYYNAIVNSDAILVLNFDKNGISNYVGGNTLMEIGFAYVNNKSIYLLNPVPEIGYKDEILAMMTKTLKGDISQITKAE